MDNINLLVQIDIENIQRMIEMEENRNTKLKEADLNVTNSCKKLSKITETQLAKIADLKEEFNLQSGTIKLQQMNNNMLRSCNFLGNIKRQQTHIKNAYMEKQLPNNAECVAHKDEIQGHVKSKLDNFAEECLKLNTEMNNLQRQLEIDTLRQEENERKCIAELVSMNQFLQKVECIESRQKDKICQLENLITISTAELEEVKQNYNASIINREIIEKRSNSMEQLKTND